MAKAESEAGKVPRHVAIIMDGNGRWAQQHKLPRLSGHEAGRKSVKKVVQAAITHGVRYLTLYAFSVENWQRPRDEVQGLMGLLRLVLREELAEMGKEGGEASRHGPPAGLAGSGAGGAGVRH